MQRILCSPQYLWGDRSPELVEGNAEGAKHLPGISRRKDQPARLGTKEDERTIHMQKETQLSVFLRNVPGELGRFAELMAKSNVNILGMFIQNAADYIQEMFQARGKAIRRTASAASYGSVMNEAKQYSLIRLLVDQADKALDVLNQAQYWVDTTEVLVMRLDNKPGKLADVSKRFGDANININYVYGSGASDLETPTYIFSVPDADLALKSLSK